jgi:putative ABC transport system permease protein
MLRIAFQTLRARTGSLTGAFVAIFLAVTLAYATGLLMAGALSSPGPGRFAAADAVVRTDPTITAGSADDAVDVVPAPRLSSGVAARAAAVPGVARAVGDLAFPAGAFTTGGARVTGGDVHGHAWDSAVLTPYTLRAGHAPAGPGDVVADARLGLRVGQRLHVVAAGGERDVRVSGVARAGSTDDAGQAALFFGAVTARALSGTAGELNAVGIVTADGADAATVRGRLRQALGGRFDVLDGSHASGADAGDPRADQRESMVAIFGTMGGISGAIALFVVAGTFALAIAQRRRESAVLRALGATPRQVRRLIAGEAFFVSLVAGGLGLLAGRPLASALVDLMDDHGTVPAGFEPGTSWIPLVAALGLGIVIAQLAVVAAARRAGRTRPAEALREAAVEHARPGAVRIVSALLAIAGGVAMSIVFDGIWAQAFSILTGMLLAGGVALLGRAFLGLPAALLAWPLRRLGASGLLASTGLAANRWRTAALASPLVLIAMLAGTWGLVQHSDQHHTEATTAARVVAGHVVVGRGGAPLPAGTAAEVARLPGVRAVAATVPTEVYGGGGLTEMSPWKAVGLDVADTAGTLDLGVRAGDLGDVHGRSVAVSRAAAHDGHLSVGDDVRLRMADDRAETLRVAAVYDRAAGLGDVVLDPAVARRHAAVPAADALFVAGGGPALERYADAHTGVSALTRDGFRATVRSVNNEQSWAVWLIIGLSALFAALALVNTAAMSTAERRREFATLRLLGGTPSQAVRMVALEMLPTVGVALAAGAAVALASVAGVPRGVSGVPLAVPVLLTAGLAGGAALLGLAAGAVTARLALRATPAEAMRAVE